MEVYSVLPVVAAAAFGIATLVLSLRPAGKPVRNGWIAPLVLSIAFLLWSLYAVAEEGPLGFWREHTRSAWGNQVWFDLLLGVGTAWAFLAPRARRLGMAVLPWLALVAGTGCIGLLAMCARYLYLKERTGHAETVPTAAARSPAGS